jgi:hypothetical protein
MSRTPGQSLAFNFPRTYVLYEELRGKEECKAKAYSDRQLAFVDEETGKIPH